VHDDLPVDEFGLHLWRQFFTKDAPTLLLVIPGSVEFRE
jgi:hypothetical protein